MPDYPSTAADTFEKRNSKGQKNGYASLDDTGHVPSAQINDIDVSVGSGISPSTTVVSETTNGQSAAVGAALSYAREDHTHGTPSAAVVPSASGTVVTETTFGQGSAIGVAATFSRGDHTHGTPASGGGPPTGAASGVLGGTYPGPSLAAALLPIPQAFGTGQSATATAVATGGTITTAGVGVARVSPAGAVTGVILAVGSAANPWLLVINAAVAANSVTFDVAGTSHVANGVSCKINGLSALLFVWDNTVSLWYPSSGAATLG